jgi:hypothetical protein
VWLSGCTPRIGVPGDPVSPLQAEREVQALASGDFVAQEQQQEILIRHLLRPGEREALGWAWRIPTG